MRKCVCVCVCVRVGVGACDVRRVVRKVFDAERSKWRCKISDSMICLAPSHDGRRQQGEGDEQTRVHPTCGIRHLQHKVEISRKHIDGDQPLKVTV
jgi:hypothetical protein